MSENQFLLYGANGYTGKLIAKLSSTYNLQPILAGRTEANIKPLADELQLPYRIVDLDNATQLQNALVKKYGASILAKYGVDGMFGKEMEAALVRAKMPTSINESTYSKLVGSGLAGLIKQGEEIVTISDCEIFKAHGKPSIQAPYALALV